MQKKYSTIIILLLLIITGILLYNTFIQKNDAKTDEKTENVTSNTADKHSVEITDNQEIDELTSEEVVVPYVKENGRLPDYYITKRQAREKGLDCGRRKSLRSVARKSHWRGCIHQPGEAASGQKRENLLRSRFELLVRQPQCPPACFLKRQADFCYS